MTKPRPNLAKPEGCKLRDYPANGSLETLMFAFNCVAERAPFHCHESDRSRSDRLALRFPKGGEVICPWEHVGGADG
jgi:hypothetical protein